MRGGCWMPEALGSLCKYIKNIHIYEWLHASTFIDNTPQWWDTHAMGYQYQVLKLTKIMVVHRTTAAKIWQSG